MFFLFFIKIVNRNLKVLKSRVLDFKMDWLGNTALHLWPKANVECDSILHLALPGKKYSKYNTSLHDLEIDYIIQIPLAC